MKNTFRGGVHPAGHKDLSRESRLRLFDPKGEMVFPLSMHIGKPAKPVVKKNDEVKVGQLLAEADGFVSAPIHSSCSGKVKAIEKRRVLGGGMAECIVIDNDGLFTPAEDYSQRTEPSTLSNSDIIERVQKAGIVGLTTLVSLEFEKDGITCNAILPSAVTPGFPEERPAFGGGMTQGPEYIPPVLAFLASDDAKDVTGQFIYVSGGEVGILAPPLRFEGNAKFFTKDGKWTHEELAGFIPQMQYKRK